MKTKSGVRVKTEKVYTAAHLRRYYPQAFNRALEKYRENLDLEYVSSEMLDSLKGLFNAAGVKLADYSLGAYNRGNMLRAEFPQDGAAELSGPRALAWIENNILGPLRAPYGLRPPAASAKKYVNGTHNTVYNTDENGRPLRRWTRPGAVKDCPFTGVCYDEDFLEDLIKSVKSGRTLKEAFEDLADLFAKNLEDEYSYQAEAPQFLEHAEMNGYEFDKEGRRA